MSRYLVNARNFPPPHVEFCSVGSPRAGHVFEWAITQPIVCCGPWHHIDLLCICGSHFGALVFAAATCCARPRACSSRSVNIWMVREPLGLSSGSRLLLSASHRMTLTRGRKSSSRIARKIEIFSIFARLVPLLISKHNSRFRVFHSTICWSWWSVNIFETYGRNKIAVSSWNLISVPCSETGPKTWKFEDLPNFAQR